MKERQYEVVYVHIWRMQNLILIMSLIYLPDTQTSTAFPTHHRIAHWAGNKFSPNRTLVVSSIPGVNVWHIFRTQDTTTFASAAWFSVLNEYSREKMRHGQKGRKHLSLSSFFELGSLGRLSMPFFTSYKKYVAVWAVWAAQSQHVWLKEWMIEL